ncbi:MAG: serine/threonine protein kinase [Okeania sp. SIO2F4]|uniref:serine/threonine protein kinase n=1 Tax=Okeania sp. SIO2F4 TaxID=2607790 RepID=UPI00142B3A20|nr:serine/threonine-protein kinase [Okeania sp. SIO2F4]NES05700.1 serine/threonine protein kinase [Okeania sp. SIO2F4]
MNNYPNFSSHNYQIIRELGHNNIGGRVTYLAQNIKTQKKVVIKQFQFAKLGASWAEYDAYSQEIAVLKSLNHPGIPKYLDSFQTTDGFCMIQEYIAAESAVIYRQWQPQEIKQIAISILEILVYLQSKRKPVIHRDIKPENILIDEELKVYLVDFGFARMGGGEIAASSVVKGTMGFMSPEQIFNRQLTRSSDLYSLGATLICLLTGIKSGDIGNLIDADYRIIFRHLVPPLERGWINWLEKITEPKYTDRYKNAKKALAALRVLDVNRLPKLRISRKNLEFASNKWGEKLTGIIQISNPIPETILCGRWEVAPHVNDPPHTPYDHSWISFSPHKFAGNNVKCKIIVDTSKLVENTIHKREIILHNNSELESLKINIQVKTASVTKLEASSVLMFFFCRFLLAVVIFYWFSLLQFHPLSIVLAAISILVYALNSINNNTLKEMGICFIIPIITIVSLILILSIPGALIRVLVLVTHMSLILSMSDGLASLHLFILAKTIIPKNKISHLFSERQERLITLLQIGLNFSLIITFKIFSEVIPQLHCFTLGEILDSAIVAIALMSLTLIPLIYLILKPMKIIAKYRKSEPNLIKA